MSDEKDEAVMETNGPITAGRIIMSPEGLTFTGSSNGFSAGGGIKRAALAMGVSEEEESEPQVELVLLPQRQPRKVLVAFFDEAEDTSPAWAAYLAPEDIDINLPQSPLDASMNLRLLLAKVFEQ